MRYLGGPTRTFKPILMVSWSLVKNWPNHLAEKEPRAGEKTNWSNLLQIKQSARRRSRYDFLPVYADFRLPTVSLNSAWGIWPHGSICSLSLPWPSDSEIGRTIRFLRFTIPPDSFCHFFVFFQHAAGSCVAGFLHANGPKCNDVWLLPELSHHWFDCWGPQLRFRNIFPLQPTAYSFRLQRKLWADQFKLLWLPSPISWPRTKSAGVIQTNQGVVCQIAFLDRFAGCCRFPRKFESKVGIVVGSWADCAAKSMVSICKLETFVRTPWLTRVGLTTVGTCPKSHPMDEGMVQDAVGWCRMVQDDVGVCFVHHHW